jgi:hypothetical protein
MSYWLRYDHPHDPHTATIGQPFHGVLHAGVVNVRIDHSVSGSEALVTADQTLQRFSGASRQRDLGQFNAQCLRNPCPYRLEVGTVGSACVVRVLQVHVFDLTEILLIGVSCDAFHLYACIGP